MTAPAMVAELADDTTPEVPQDVRDLLLEARTLTRRIAELEGEVQAAHEARGAALVALRRSAAGMSYADLAAVIGVNRQRVHTLVYEAQHGARTRRRRPYVAVEQELLASDPCPACGKVSDGRPIERTAATEHLVCPDCGQ